MSDRPSMRALGAVVAASAAIFVLVGTEASAAGAGNPSPAASAARARSFRLGAADWVIVKNAVRLRRLALAPGRSAFYRSFAAELGLSGLTTLHPIRRGRCAIAISYLYDNLLDLAHAYPGEDWQPLRRLVRKQPSLQVCAPKAHPRPTYVA